MQNVSGFGIGSHSAFVTAIAAAAVVATSAQAVIINPGETVELFGTTEQLEPQFYGPIAKTIDETDAYVLYEFAHPGGEFYGALEHSVRNTPGGLASWYRIADFHDNGFGWEVVAISTELLHDHVVEADYLLDQGGDVGPSTAKFLGCDGPVDFDFSNPVLSGQTSYTMAVLNNENDLVSELCFYGGYMTLRDAMQDTVEIGIPAFVPHIPAPPAILGLVGVIAMQGRSTRR